MCGRFSGRFSGRFLWLAAGVSFSIRHRPPCGPPGSPTGRGFVYTGLDVAIRPVYIGAMEKRMAIGLKLPPSLVAAVDAERATFEFPPERTELIEKLLVEWLERRRQERQRSNGVAHVRQL